MNDNDSMDGSPSNPKTDPQVAFWKDQTTELISFHWDPPKYKLPYILLVYIQWAIATFNIKGGKKYTSWVDLSV